MVRAPASLQPQIKRIVSSMNPATAVEFKNMDSLISGSIVRERSQTVLLVLFAACALLLSVVGIYGLLALRSDAPNQRNRFANGARRK